MAMIRDLVRAYALTLALVLAGSFAIPEVAFGSSETTRTCAEKKSKKKRIKRKKRSKRAKKRARRGRRARARKVTSKKIIGWWNAGYSEREIIKRLDKANYRPTELALKRLQRQVSPTLLTSIEARAPGFAVARAEPVEAVTEPAAKKVAVAKRVRAAPVQKKAVPAKRKAIKLEILSSDTDIDFDSIPPPAGMPATKATKRAEDSHQLDRSLRPSAPFEPGSGASDDGAPTRRRVVISSSDNADGDE